MINTDNCFAKTEDGFQVSRLQDHPGEKRRLATVLGRALFDDPFAHFAYGDEKRRREILPQFIENFINGGLCDGHVDVLVAPSGEIAGGAVWMGPERPVTSTVSFLLRMVTHRTTLMAAVRLGIAGLSRISDFGETIEGIHKQVPLPHYYLATLGIAPEFQGRGLGGVLLAPVLQKAEQERLLVYVESTNANNLSFYKRLGFGRVHDGKPADGPPFFVMRKR